ncbi:hypothetical protein ACU4GI_20535 [Cupriavidus basilensis]
MSILQRRRTDLRHLRVVFTTQYLLLPGATSMSRYLPFVARAFGVGTFIVIVAIVSRQVYLRSAAEAADADEEPATMMLMRCETMHKRLQNPHRPAAEADERPRARCRES